LLTHAVLPQEEILIVLVLQDSMKLVLNVQPVIINAVLVVLQQHPVSRVLILQEKELLAYVNKLTTILTQTNLAKLASTLA